MKVKHGMVVRIKTPIKSKIGDSLENIGTVVTTYGTDCEVLLPDGNIWKGSDNELAPAKLTQPVAALTHEEELPAEDLELNERLAESQEHALNTRLEELDNLEECFADEPEDCVCGDCEFAEEDEQTE